MRWRSFIPGLAVVSALVVSSCSSDGAASSAATPTTPSGTSQPATTPAATTSAATTTEAPNTEAPTTATTSAPAIATSATCPDGAPSAIICLTVAVPVDPAVADGPTLDLAVTVRRANDTTWTSPVLSILGTTPSYPWTDPNAATVFDGHDVIWVDQRGAGRSEGVTTCPDLPKFAGEIRTANLGSDALAALKACFAAAAAGPVPFASIFDHNVVAADIGVVRRALGIDAWALYAGSAGADIALHLVDQEPASVTAIVTRTPTAVGAGGSTNDLAAAFARFVADCAAATECSKAGDLEKAFELTYQRLAVPVTTKSLEPGTGTPIVLDQHALLDSLHSIGSVALATSVATLLPGGVDGSSDEAVATAFATSPIDPFAWPYVGDCQSLDYTHPGLITTADDKAGLFAGYTTHRFCDAIGPLPQYPERAQPASDVPVLVVLPSYDPRSSVTTVKQIFGGFPNTTVIEVPGSVDPIQQLRECFFATANAFLADPTGSVDSGCLTSPAVVTLK
ncbi:MAG: hypothetical protein RLZZ623_998 [Actinomycetota bacterium]